MRALLDHTTALAQDLDELRRSLTALLDEAPAAGSDAEDEVAPGGQPEEEFLRAYV